MAVHSRKFWIVTISILVVLRCRVYDPAQIKVGKIPDGVVNKPVHFTGEYQIFGYISVVCTMEQKSIAHWILPYLTFLVDASDGGVGNLEVAVNEGKIPSMAQALGQHRYEISFVPRDNYDHTISVRFNNEAVPGSPFLCRLLSALQVG